MNLKQFSKNIGFYFLGNFATKILQILFIPLYTVYIATSDFGYYNLTSSIITLAVPILYQSIWEGILRFVIDNEGGERKVISTATIYTLGLTAVYAIIFFSAFSIFKIQYGNVMLLMAIGQMAASYWQFLARALKMNKIYAMSTVVNSAVTIALNLILILGFSWGINALFIANTVGNFVMVIVLEYNLKLFKSLRFSLFDMKVLKSIIKYSFPLCINAISWWLILSSNSLVISYKLGVFQNGIYSMASRFGSIMQLVTSVVNMAWLEEAFRIHGNEDSDSQFNNVLDMLIKIVLSGVALLIPVTYVFYQFFVYGDYKTGVSLTPIIYLNAAYSAFASHLGSGFLARKESDIIFRTTLVSGIISVAGAYLLVDVLGVMGVVVTSLIGSIFMFIIRIPMLNNRMELKVNYTSLILLTTLCIALLYMCNLNPSSLIYQSLIFIAVCFVIIIINRELFVSILIKLKTKLKRG